MAEHVARLRLAQIPKPIDRARAVAAAAPYRDDRRMDGAPTCSAADFETLRLRRCPFDLATIDWKSSSRMDGRLDGYIWKVWFGEDGPYVLKVVSSLHYSPCSAVSPTHLFLLSLQFWDTGPHGFVHYFAVQREWQNAALLQMMEAAVQQAATGLSPPALVNANPRTKRDAKANIYAFSCEGRQRQSPSPGEIPETIEISSIPHMKKCYGWLTVSGEVFQNLPTS